MIDEDGRRWKRIELMKVDRREWQQKMEDGLGKARIGKWERG